LKPASTTPRSYGRRHRSWHHGNVHATHNERRRGQRPGNHGQVPATHNERCREQLPEHYDQLPLLCSGFCSKLRAQRRGTSLGPFVCGARVFSLCLSH
jgi:hypothetical protein